VDRKYILKYNVYFQTNKSKLRSRYYDKLREISELLIDNPDLGVEILGFTDTRGENEQNQILSELRARAVMQYFAQLSINPHRIILQGFGETRSLAESDDRDKQNNRRVEVNVFQIVESTSLEMVSDINKKELNEIYPVNTDDYKDDIIYKIQVLSCTIHRNKKDAIFKGISVSEYRYGLNYNYVYGSFKTRAEANKEILKIRELGFDDAFVVEFLQNKRVN